MAKNISPANNALWIIAFSLAIIAACLVVLVTRQQNTTAIETVEAPTVEPKTGKASPSSKLPRTFAISRTQRHPQAESPASEPAPKVVEIVREAPVTPAAGIQPIVSSGLAPLTFLGATNTNSDATAVITGRVILEGTPPPETVIPLDPQCGKLHRGTATTHRYAVSRDGGLANVFVFISDGLEGKQFATPSQPVLLDQKGCLFEPSVLGLMVNQNLRIKNSDGVLHTVHSTPLAPGNEAFNVAEQPRVVVTKTFGTPELALKLRCDVHPWMFAYVRVMDHPFFAVTDAKGNYTISNVPPGNYVLEAFHVKTHNGREGETQPITVASGETTTANFTITLPTTNARIAERR